MSGDSSSKAVFFLSMQIDASIRRMTNTSNTFDRAPWPIGADVAGVTVQLGDNTATQPIERVRQLVAMIRARFPNSEVRFIDTVCQPTKQRQSAAVALAQQCDAVVVIGGANSKTFIGRPRDRTRELYVHNHHYAT